MAIKKRKRTQIPGSSGLTPKVEGAMEVKDINSIRIESRAPVIDDNTRLGDACLTETERELKRVGLFDPIQLEKADLLNPADWDGEPCQPAPWSAQSERIAAGMELLLDDHNGCGGRYKWHVGLYIEDDIPGQKVLDWKVLSVTMIRHWWTKEFQRGIGLIQSEGALVWPGRGAHEEHFIMVIRKDSWLAQEALAAKASEDRLLASSDLEDKDGNPELWEKETEQIEIPKGALHDDEPGQVTTS